MNAMVSYTAALSVLLSGCAMRSDRTSTSNTAPSGPIQAQTTNPNLIPAGTTVAIRANEAISSTDAAGKAYLGEVAQDIVDQNGRLLVPRGAPAELVVTESNSGGAVGTRSVELAVRSITVNGRKHVVSTEEQEVQGNSGLGANRRTAEMVGGGAALGTLLGAVIGGGAGAAAGAAVGAAGGAAAQVLTRGNEIRVPAETVLTFRLEQPMRLT